jgi:hypothetical protein
MATVTAIHFVRKVAFFFPILVVIRRQQLSGDCSCQEIAVVRRLQLPRDYSCQEIAAIRDCSYQETAVIWRQQLSGDCSYQETGKLTTWLESRTKVRFCYSDTGNRKWREKLAYVRNLLS